MTVLEWEAYILQKTNVRKRVVLPWRTVRYTLYASPMALFRLESGGIVFTVRGRFETYEKEYPDAVFPSRLSELFTDIAHPEKLPEHVLKSMTDYAYRACASTVPAPHAVSPTLSDDSYAGIEARLRKST